MCYTVSEGGQMPVDDRIIDLYKLPDIGEYEDIHLLTLREQCEVLEQQLRQMLPDLPERYQQKMTSYLDLRDELEVQTVKAALRWGKRHYR